MKTNRYNPRAITPRRGSGSNMTPTDQERMRAIGQIANELAGSTAFDLYRAGLSKHSLRRHDTDLILFSRYLYETKELEVGDLLHNPADWSLITWGLVDGFVRWQLAQGYAVASVNMRLSTVKVYAGLAARAGFLDQTELIYIQQVKGFSQSQGRNLDQKRRQESLETRVGRKKAQAVNIPAEIAAALIDQPDTPQGRRDRLLMCLMLQHGLRAGELAHLQVEDFQTLSEGEFIFYRPKVGKHQIHRLTEATLDAARRYFELGDAPLSGPLLRKSRKDDTLLPDAGMTERAITKRVATLGAECGLPGLSAHDCRHYWATTAARNNTPIDRLQEAGGWNSPAMPLRYIIAARVANEGVILEKDPNRK